MPKLPPRKRGFYVMIDERVYENLMDLVRRKHAKPYGALSSEVQDALAHWIQECGQTLELHTNTHKKVNPALPHSHRQAKEIIDWLRDRGFSLQCSLGDLEKAISNTRGSDPRTTKKWIRFLTGNGYIKWVTHRNLEIL